MHGHGNVGGQRPWRGGPDHQAPWPGFPQASGTPDTIGEVHEDARRGRFLIFELSLGQRGPVGMHQWIGLSWRST